MRKTLLSLIFLSFTTANAIAEQKTMDGRILDYGCAEDYCYLTVIDNKGKQRVGICTASLCKKWENSGGKMPSQFKDRKVRLVVEKTMTYGGDMMDTFKKLNFLTQ